MHLYINITLHLMSTSCVAGSLNMSPDTDKSHMESISSAQTTLHLELYFVHPVLSY